MNTQLGLSKIEKCLTLASEFVKDENTIYVGSCHTMMTIGGTIPQVEKKSVNIRKEAEEKASKLERQEECAKLIRECLEYIKTVNKFENQQ